MANMKLILLVAFFACASAYTIEKKFFHEEGSCVGRCSQTGVEPGTCQCNRQCQQFGDCCADYVEVCLATCAGRCNMGVNSTLPCQCSRSCVSFGDCCPDYEDLCADRDDVTDLELSELSEELLQADINNVAQYVSIDLQRGSPLLNVSNAAYTGPTISRLLALFDNYCADVRETEVDTPIDLAEREAFLNAVFNTTVMQRTQEFLASKNLPNGREIFEQIWFEHYSRGGGVLSTSGFENAFLAEISANGINGIGNWLYYAREENNGNAIYGNGQISQDLGDKGSIVEFNYTWRNISVPITTMYIGTSPEFELALYTVCYYARRNAKCPVTLNGELIKITTYNISQNGKNYVSTAYIDFSD